MKELFQQINEDLTGSKFIQKYEWLGQIITNKNEINVIELLLAFQFDNKSFDGTDAYIGHRVCISKTSVNDVLKRLDKAGIIIRSTYFDPKKKKKIRTIKVNAQHLVNLLNLSKEVIKEETIVVGSKPIQKKINKQPTQSREVKAIPPTEVKETVQPETEIVLKNDYPFRTKDFNPGKMLLRYSDPAESIYTLINDFEVHWAKTGKGIIEMIDLVGYLIKRKNIETDNHIKQIIQRTLEGISADNKIYFQTAAA